MNVAADHQNVNFVICQGKDRIGVEIGHIRLGLYQCRCSFTLLWCRELL
jgi:hypothetical protein